MINDFIVRHNLQKSILLLLYTLAIFHITFGINAVFFSFDIELIKKYFPKENTLSKLLNKNTVKGQF